MRLKTRWSISVVYFMVFLSLIYLEQYCPANGNENFKPLFPINLDYGFPKAKETFEEVKEIILENYYSDEITEEALYWSAIQGMLRHISPPEHPELAKIWTAEEYEKVLLVEIKSFTTDLSQKLSNELKKYKGEGIKGLIIDLRNNSGGLFVEALKTVELFLPEKHILLRTLQRETGLQNYVSANKEPFEFNISVLVNDKTASSAEILASALQDHQKAFIIGTRTYGKGVFDKTFELKNHFRTRFITGAMYSPKGKAGKVMGLPRIFLLNKMITRWHHC